MRTLISTLLILLSALTVPAFAQMPGMQVGDKAPDFTAQDFRGQTVQLSAYFPKGPVVLIFYRGSWCPYCNKHLKDIQDHIAEIKNFNASVIAVSVDKIDKAAEAAENNELDFDVVSNPEGDILESYGLTYVVPDELNDKYKNEYSIDLENASGRTDHMIAIPATYIIDRNGVIAFAYANEDYKVRTPAATIIYELEKLQKEASHENIDQN